MCLVWCFLWGFLEVDGILENVPNASHVSHFAVGSSAGGVLSIFYDRNKLTNTKHDDFMSNEGSSLAA